MKIGIRMFLIVAAACLTFALANPAHAAPATSPTPTSYVTTHSTSVSAAECSALLLKGYSRAACTITFTATIRVQEMVHKTVQGVVPLATCGTTSWFHYEMTANQGPLWAVEEDTIFAVNLCSVSYDSGSKSCYYQYEAIGVAVSNTNCNAGNAGSDGFANSTFSITILGVYSVTERMSETITPQSALHPSYNCSPNSCT